MTENIARQLQKEGFVLMHTVGISMKPMLHERREQNLIRSLSSDPKVNDVVLYRRGNGQYVLHRVIRRKNGNYIIRGDNCYASEKIPRSRLIGVLEGFYRADRFIDCRKNAPYRLYVWLWRLSYPLRYLLHRLRRTLGRLYRRLFPRK